METLLRSAIERRVDWLSKARTDSYRVFHGIAEGAPGITIDRYGSEAVVQVFRESAEENWDSLAALVIELLPDLSAVSVVRRGKAKEVLARVGVIAQQVQCHEEGRLFWNSLSQRGNDPWFYLDFRAARRFIASHSEGKRVANFFAYTGTAGVTAAVAGASQVSNVDFGGWCTEVSTQNCQLNHVEVRNIRDDFFRVARQWAGGKAKNRRQRGGASYKAERFDLVILDPPTRSKGRNGAVDIIRDYPSLAKPCMQMLDPGGWLLCTHHHSALDFEEWQAIVLRTANKIGREITQEIRIATDPDFPSLGDEPLLKVLAIQLA